MSNYKVTEEEEEQEEEEEEEEEDEEEDADEEEGCVIRLNHISLIKLKKGLGNPQKCQNKGKKC